MYVNPLIRAAMMAPAQRAVTSFSLKGKFAHKRAATWARNNPSRFISAVARHGVVIVNCYVRSDENSLNIPFKLQGTHQPIEREPKSHRRALALAAAIDAMQA